MIDDDDNDNDNEEEEEEEEDSATINILNVTVFSCISNSFFIDTLKNMNSTCTVRPKWRH
jgi:hypothetical protein